MKKIAISLTIATVIIFLDQISKYILIPMVINGEVIEVSSFFNLVMVWNRGVSFGMFASDAEIMRWVLSTLAVVISIALLIWVHKDKIVPRTLPVGLIVGGAIGNVIDRIRFGAVADFFDFHLMGYHWPAFNIADSCIFIGVVIVLAQEFKNGKKSENANAAGEKNANN